MPTNWPFGGRFLAIAGCVTLLCMVFLLTPSSRLETRPSKFWHSDDSLQSEAKQISPSPVAESHPLHTPQPNHPKCGVTKVTMLYGGHKDPIFEHAVASHRRHSERWGCGFVELKYDVAPRKLYSKHYILLSTMIQELAKPEDQRQKWLMWIDADSILINPGLSPEIFLPPDHIKDVYALMTADHNGLNDGVFFLRVDPISLDLLTHTAAYPIAHPDDDVGFHGEQAAMARVISSLETQAGTDFSGIAWLPRPWFNTYQFAQGFEGEPGHMMVHFAGVGPTRNPKMQAWLDELSQNQAKWEIEFEQTFYKDAVAKYWEEFSVNKTAHIGGHDSNPHK
ncbi:glycosyltransferase family 34 protein [Myriangium duriaei CBS 260.36]|uniref:Glycosyltransferase family 34 protein n=1 Tax=Myriangium duriaei CBS 260.36 TaxID=1168546 RepID=A0A9P4J7G0_9PEZI|nr:glycosyltransferase family 34 protein [Myriangium duriaei CBS 260.36]